MRESIHQKQDSKYPHGNSEEEQKLKAENDIKNPGRRDVTEDESIIELEESAGSEEGIGTRGEGLQLEMDVGEDREDNTEGRLPDIPPSAIKR